jgi:UDP-N-acetylmuramate: L-alanyl-gamma-D-glutamyl-meso-diaminopimelate ligase
LHLHILGICGTFMGGIAAIAREAGHRVTGSDRNVYPPMSTQLAALGVDVIEGYEPDQLKLNPDIFVVGNVMSRGNPLVEALLDSGRRYESGPEWLARNVLQADGRWVLAVAGTHGKTTASSLLAWILEHAGLSPGFLIGGVPIDFGVSARLGSGRHFVIEADEYDTAFFDKRAKFVHYRPRTAILNNLEHDHADIYADVAAIQRQFHLLLRTIPGNGRLIVNADEPNLHEALAMGCWTPVEQLQCCTRECGGRVAYRRGAGWRLRLVRRLARRALHRSRRLARAGPSQRRQRAGGAGRGAPRRRVRNSCAGGAALLSRREAPTRGPRRGRRHHRL